MSNKKKKCAEYTIQVVGARGRIDDIEKVLHKLQEYMEKHEICAQIFNAELVFGSDHLVSAVKHAVRALRRESNSTNSLEMETLLYASGERQIKNAVPKMGIKKNAEKTALVFIGDLPKVAPGKISEKNINEFIATLGLTQDDSVLQGDPEVLKRFGITHEELSTVKKDKYGDLVLEKVAMVDIIK